MARLVLPRSVALVLPFTLNTMVLTDRQRRELHAGIYEYLKSRPGPDFEAAAQALLKADPEAGASATQNGSSTTKTVKTPVLEKKWTAIPRLQKKVLELERIALQNKTLYAHRSENGSNALERRLLPRLPTTHIMQGHTAVVTTVAVHPTYTVAASGSEDGTIKVRASRLGLLWRLRTSDVSVDVRVQSDKTNVLTNNSTSPLYSRFGTTRVANTCVRSKAIRIQFVTFALRPLAMSWHRRRRIYR